MLYVVAVPLAFAVFWGLSLAIPRRYLNEGAKVENKDYVDVMTSLLWSNNFNVTVNIYNLDYIGLLNADWAADNKECKVHTG